jgi:hypothetical protein
MSMRKPVIRIEEDFLRDLHADYRAHGAEAIANLRKEQPRLYFQLVDSFLYNAVPEPVSPSGNPELGDFAGE